MPLQLHVLKCVNISGLKGIIAYIVVRVVGEKT